MVSGWSAVRIYVTSMPPFWFAVMVTGAPLVYRTLPSNLRMGSSGSPLPPFCGAAASSFPPCGVGSPVSALFSSGAAGGACSSGSTGAAGVCSACCPAAAGVCPVGWPSSAQAAAGSSANSMARASAAAKSFCFIFCSSLHLLDDACRGGMFTISVIFSNRVVNIFIHIKHEKLCI